MRRLTCAALVAVLSTAAMAQYWNDNFDSYANGSQLHGVGGWKGWDNSAGAGALVSDAQSTSAPNSVDINGGSDLVQVFSGATSGSYTFLSKVYVPGNYTGTSYFIMLNQYNDGGPYNWSVQIHFDAATDTAADDFGTGSVAFTRDTWLDLMVFIDLDADVVTSFLNGNTMGTRSWKGATGFQEVAAIDLFANGASTIYYDDMQLVPEPATMSALALGALALVRRRRK